MAGDGAAPVLDAPALQDAIGRRVPHIVAEGEISGMPMITLSEGQRLPGGTLRFGASGVRLRRNNVLEGVTIIVPENERAVLNDASVPDWGRLELRDVRTEGQVAEPWRGPAAQPGVAHSIACLAARQALTHRHASGRAPRRPARRTCHGQASGHG